jgi:hypothetical protein
LYVYQRVFQECVKFQVDPSWETLKLVPTCSKQWGCSSTKFMSIWPLQVKKSRLAGFITYPGYTWSHKVIPIHIFHSKPSLTPKYHSLILYISPHYRMVPTYLLERKNTCEYPEPLRTAPSWPRSDFKLNICQQQCLVSHAQKTDGKVKSN